jgi:hypothetical protein
MNTVLVLADAANNAAGFLFGFGAFTILLIVLASIFWIWMLIDAITNQALDSTMKVVWVLVILFLHFVGALAYLILGRKPRAV